MASINKLIKTLSPEIIRQLKSWQQLRFSGVIYTVRDQAHRKLVELIRKKKKLPFDLAGRIFYYSGPTATPKGRVIGSCGPTTSRRMDAFAPGLLKAGLSGMIGKGNRSKEVKQAIKKYKGVYFLTYAGCGALLSQYVLSAKPIAFRELGPEAIYKLKVKDFPLIVAIDSKGGSVYG